MLDEIDEIQTLAGRYTLQGLSLGDWSTLRA